MKNRRWTWGVATSAAQIEGAVDEDGRGPSIWDEFASRPGTIEDGSTPAVACDHYHRWREDVALMREIGVDAYRFSVAWPRVIPSGAGPVNERGLDFYDRLVDALVAANIEPVVTLYHWDLPLALQEKGGWTARETCDAFVEYARAVARRLGNRVSRWITHNEPWCIATLGYEEGHHAPGWRDPAAAMRVAHHVLLSHGLAVDALREELGGARVGIVLNLSPACPLDEGNPGDVDAARWFDGFFNRWYLDPLLRGAYPDDAIADRVARGHLEDAALPFVEPGDLDVISRPIDFLGVNYYGRTVLRAGPDGRPEAVRVVPEEELTDMGWEVWPQGLERLLRRLDHDYAPREIVVTECGAAWDDPPGPDGRIHDERRIDFLDRHIDAALAARRSGVPVTGFFVWSLMDNFEWAHGYTKRFGLVHVDYTTLRRTPRESATWYSRTIRTRPVPGSDESTPRRHS